MNSTNLQAFSAQTDTALHPAVQQLEQEIVQLRAALYQSADQWRATFEQAAVGMAHTALNGQWLRVNQRLCAMLGYSAEELLGTSVQAITHPDHWADNLTAIHQLLAGKIQRYVTNKRYLHKNGGMVWGRLTLSLARTADGFPAYFVAVLEDITELKQTEDALRTSEERYRRIVEDQTDLICRFQPDFRLTFVNRAYAESAGKEPADLIGMRILDLIPADYQAQVINHVTVQNPTGHLATSENPVRLADGSLRWFEWTDRAILDEQGAVIEYQAVGRDVTARRQAEEAERTQRQFAEALRDSLAALTGSLDVDQVMTQILISAATVVPSEAGCIILFEEGYGRIAYCRGFTPEITALLHQHRFPIDSWSNIHHAFVHKAPYVVLDTHTTADWGEFPPTAWIRSSIGVPIELGGAVIGLLIADSATPGYFQPTDVEKLQAFARYASLALANAHHAALLEQQVAERTRELQAAKEQVEAILNHSRDGIVLVQPDLRIVQSNAAFRTLFYGQGTDDQEQSLLALIHPDDVAQVKTGLACAWQQKGDTYLEAPARRSDGSLFDAELSIGELREPGFVCTLRDITERKARERHLRYYASLQENVSEAVIVVDINWVIQSWNKAAESIYGWRAAEVIGKSGVTVLQTRYLRDLNHEQVWQILLAQGRWQAEVIQPRKDGTLLHILASLTLLRDEQGQILGIVGINRDITEQKQAALALAESRHFAAQITEAAPNHIYIYDMEEGCNIYSNHNIAALLGYSPQEIQALGNRLIREMMHPDDHKPFAAHVTRLRLAQDKKSFVFTYRMRHKNGGWRWFESHDTVFRRNAAGQVVQLLGVATNVTERKLAEDALRAQRDFLQFIIDSVPALILVKDQAGRYQLVNQHAAQIVGLTAATMLGKTDAAVLPNPAEVAFMRQKDEEALTAGHPLFIQEQTIRGAYYQTSKIPLRNEAGVVDRLLIVSVDISTRKAAEAALQQALQTEKDLSALKSGFITTASHEFRTPLAAILALTETLSAYRHRLTEAQIADRLHKIQQQVQRLQTLMADVLELARIQAHRARFTPVALDPAAFCRELMAEYQTLFAVTHRLLYNSDDTLPLVALDKRLFRQIITNLLANAVKYSTDDKPVTVTLTYTGELLIVQVQDEGIGIPAPDIHHLFQPFHRAGNVSAIPGTGLGLAITKEAVALHGGTITVTSELGVGTTFTVTLPVAARRAIPLPESDGKHL
ncbi:MAG: PAS domain S-box protein [Caldilineaceae bacterium]